MVQCLSIYFFLGFIQFLLGFLKVPVFLCHSVHMELYLFGPYITACRGQGQLLAVDLLRRL